MANAPRPALPREQDEWSLLSEYDAKRDREKKLEVRREKIVHAPSQNLTVVLNPLKVINSIERKI